MYVVTAWYYSSEASYSFGPFKREKTAYDFANKIAEDDTKVNSVEVIYVNSPTLYGTGSELS